MGKGNVSGLERSALIKKYIAKTFAIEDQALLKAKERANQAGLPLIEVPATVGKLLYTLVKIHQPRRVLEIGTLAGYSTLWLAKAIPSDGHIVTIDCNPEHVEVARKNLIDAGFERQVTLKLGLASEILKEMATSEHPFDLIFIDADKENYPIYLHWALKLARKGTLILSDNLIPKEQKIGEPDPLDQEACGIYQYNKEIASHPDLESILITTIVGEKGRIDALGLTIVN
jgi:predicted O-methyltransferase YrrM